MEAFLMDFSGILQLTISCLIHPRCTLKDIIRYDLKKVSILGASHNVTPGRSGPLAITSLALDCRVNTPHEAFGTSQISMVTTVRPSLGMAAVTRFTPTSTTLVTLFVAVF
jgi:hypothetical protein